MTVTDTHTEKKRLLLIFCLPALSPCQGKLPHSQDRRSKLGHIRGMCSPQHKTYFNEALDATKLHPPRPRAATWFPSELSVPSHIISEHRTRTDFTMRLRGSKRNESNTTFKRHYSLFLIRVRVAFKTLFRNDHSLVQHT